MGKYFAFFFIALVGAGSFAQASDEVGFVSVEVAKAMQGIGLLGILGMVFVWIFSQFVDKVWMVRKSHNALRWHEGLPKDDGKHKLFSYRVTPANSDATIIPSAIYMGMLEETAAPHVDHHHDDPMNPDWKYD